MPKARHPDARMVLHGHFYQPPRESPWTEQIPEQPSAHPHHDWNERIYHECYRPNTASRMLTLGDLPTGIQLDPWWDKRHRRIRWPPLLVVSSS